MATLINIPEYNDAQTLDFLAVAAMLLFAALLFVSFALPVLKSHISVPNRVISSELGE